MPRYTLGGFTPNAWITALAKELGYRGKNRLLTMTENNDPFNRGTEGDFEKAEWFKEIFETYGYDGIHLRRLHYRTVHADAGLTLPDGTPYQNTDEVWKKLQAASATARILGIVNASAFVDKRVKTAPILNQKAHVLLWGEEPSEEPTFWVEPPDYTDMLPLAQSASGLPAVYGVTDLGTPDTGVRGYDYDPVMQPHVVEIWSEKSGDDVTLDSLAHKHGINYVQGLGFASITNIRAMLKRIEETDKPGRILYVADFDPAGAAMSRSVARQCQFSAWELETVAGEVAPSVKIDAVAVTKEQIEKLGIPRVPIKEKDPRKAAWELANGVGGVEIDALESIRPGYLGRVLEERIEELLDPKLETKVRLARYEAANLVREAALEVQEARSEELAELTEKAEALEARYTRLYDALGAEVSERYNRLYARFSRERGVLHTDLERLQNEVAADLEDLEVTLPGVPEGETRGEIEERDWLYDSERSFLEQTQHLRRAQGKE
jgi:hypothetical protein